MFKLRKVAGLGLAAFSLLLAAACGNGGDDTPVTTADMTTAAAVSTEAQTEDGQTTAVTEATADGQEETTAAMTATESTTEPVNGTEGPELTGPLPPEVGIYGWDTYRHLDRLAQLSTGVQTYQFSSFDRMGGNEHDGFDGRFSYLSRSRDGFVLAEAAGAGEIQSIWFTRDGGNVRGTGNIIIELDGEVVVNESLQALVNGETGAPFVFPFVANADESSGGVTIKVPMPYRESMKVITTQNPLFHHVSYRSFVSAEGIETFDPSYIPEDIMEAAASWGYEDPKPVREDAELVESSFALEPGETATLAEIAPEGSGMIRELQLVLPTITGAPQMDVIQDDGRAFTGSSSFNITLHPDNEGAILTRRYDSVSTNQKAAVLVDGEEVTQWTGRGSRPGGWIEESVELPASATSGREQVRITNAFISAGLDYSEFRYFVDSIVDGERVRTDEIDIGPFTSGLASEREHDYEIVGQQWSGDRVNVLPPEDEDDEAIMISDALLEDLFLVITADGHRTVEAPVGEFFGSGLGLYEVRALMYSMDPESVYTSWWGMPFSREIIVSLENRSDHPLSDASSRITWAPEEDLTDRLEGSVPSLGYFRTQHRRGDIPLGRDWMFLDTDGQGRFMGVNHTMDGSLPAGNTRGYLEGDERFQVDGLRTPQWHGTGTEDFYEGGWYFNRGPFSNPMNGAPATEAGGLYGTRIQSDAAFRLLIGDAVDFHLGIEAGVEPGGFSEHDAYYSSTAFWYGHETPVMQVVDSINIGDTADEEAHNYTGGGEISELNASFEGNLDSLKLTREYRNTDEPVSFEVAIDSSHAGVRLTRMSDQNRGYQEAEVYIDGEYAGLWLQPLANAYHRWLDDSFDLPRQLTAGKSSLSIELRPTERSEPWSAARYQVLNIVPR